MENRLLEWLLNVIDGLPDVGSLNIPYDVYLGINKLTAFVGYYMPFDLYQPLFTFILAFTAFRIVYAIYMRIKK